MEIWTLSNPVAEHNVTFTARTFGVCTHARRYIVLLGNNLVLFQNFYIYQRPHYIYSYLV